ncbi:hypothetical protein ATANTOWER_024933 [Ataeniobius toweri]|uniref:Uncharacterized protein n=1 Tax=Ataeniobius toweri TaxID=208326 RepID=A0ABU7AUM8_9TELE|nr:hypothetical protein [Ataeniobius toweri]
MSVCQQRDISVLCLSFQFRCGPVWTRPVCWNVPHPGGTDDQTLAWESWALAFYSGSSDLLLPPSSSSHLLSPLVQ